MPLFLSEICHATPADLADCRARLRGGSRTFLAASHLLPRRVRDPAISLYAFCRVADDAIDLDPDPMAALGTMRARLAAIHAGEPAPIPEDRAMADTVEEFSIPRALPEALMEGFAWDASGRRYETLSDVAAYAVRVAGTVGMMMALLMGARTPDLVARACDLGVAMQFSNIARDVGEDAAAGRLYLPKAWLRESGLDPDAWLANPRPVAAIADAVRRLLAEADVLYDRALAGIAGLPRSCRPGIGAARALYAEIGHEVARRGHDPVSSRAVVSGRRKVAVLAGSLLARQPAHALAAPMLPEAAFLAAAVAAAPVPAAFATRAEGFLPARPRFASFIDMCIRLEQRERFELTAAE